MRDGGGCVRLESGIGRVIAPVQSGRDWVQRLHAWMDSRLTVSNSFQSLKSQRRLRLVGEVAGDVCRQLDTSSAVDDPLAAHPELDDFAVYASDGHYEAAATACGFYGLLCRSISREPSTPFPSSAPATGSQSQFLLVVTRLLFHMYLKLRRYLS